MFDMPKPPELYHEHPPPDQPRFMTRQPNTSPTGTSPALWMLAAAGAVSSDPAVLPARWRGMRSCAAGGRPSIHSSTSSSNHSPLRCTPLNTESLDEDV